MGESAQKLILARRWNKIEAVASALLRAGRLDAAALDEVAFRGALCAI